MLHCGKTSLKQILGNIGFKWKKHNGRAALYEVPHIASHRLRFLRTYVANLHAENPLDVVFLDETWIFQKGTNTLRTWQDGSSKCVKRLETSDGRRFIILHAGTAEGFVEHASLIFSTKNVKSDYHGEMNTTNFLKWMEDQLLPKLEAPSLIIMDNASYHSSQVETCPNTSWKKADIQEWLQKRNIRFQQNFLKAELLEIVKRWKPEKRYEADELAARYGHQVLRLPPYHCIFNAIENIWGITKNFYNKNIGRDGFDIEKSINMWEEALSKITPDVWAATVRHTNEEILRWWEREKFLDTSDIAPVIINPNEDSSDSSSSHCDSDGL